MISFSHKGSFRDILNFLTRAPSIDYHRILHVYGAQGVSALRAHTPVDTGASRDSWGYSVSVGKGRSKITWTNSNVTNSGVPIVILIQYGHGTRQGGYVQGKDFINPALLPVFGNLADAVWREVQAL